MRKIIDRILKFFGLRKNQRQLLFVCTGNTCRSPMAEIIFNHMYRETDWNASSAGTNAIDGAAMSSNARLMVIGQTKDLNPYNHRSRCLSRQLIEKADKIVCLGKNHYNQIIESFPEYYNKIRQLNKHGISDPYGGDIDTYQECCNEIEDAIEELELA